MSDLPTIRHRTGAPLILYWSVILTGLALWTWFLMVSNDAPEADTAHSPAVDRCIEDWDKYDWPDQRLWDCLERAGWRP